MAILEDSIAQLPARYDVVIDEILADPTPVIGLPNSEFIELKNVSAHAFDLRQWKISDGSSTATISISYLLLPDSFVIICPSSAVNAFSSIGPSIGVSNFPSLNNDEDLISLVSAAGSVVHSVNYRVDWFNNAVKSEGGWTLEMIDTHSPCASQSNWKASVDPTGGTAGRRNSVDAINPDTQPPAFIRSYVIDSVTIIAVFDESLDSIGAATASNYHFNDASLTIMSAMTIPPLFKEVQLKLGKGLQAGKIYELLSWVSGLLATIASAKLINNRWSSNGNRYA
jgi:hypothetical protein